MNYRQIYARNQMFGDCGNFIDNKEKSRIYLILS